MTSYSRPPGPARKPESQRRRANKPKSCGAAEPTTAPAAAPADRELGVDNAHPLVEAMWGAVQQSCESRSTQLRIGSGCTGSCSTRTRCLRGAAS
jgi:hypothetical protein